MFRNYFVMRRQCSFVCIKAETGNFGEDENTMP
jgi:hypothetical protein